MIIIHPMIWAVHNYAYIWKSWDLSYHRAKQGPRVTSMETWVYTFKPTASGQRKIILGIKQECNEAKLS